MIQNNLCQSDIAVLQSELLNASPTLVHFSTLRNADNPNCCVGAPTDAYRGLNLCSYSGDEESHVSASRMRVAEALGIPVTSMWFPTQVHGTDICVVDRNTPQDLKADAVITRERNLCIGVSTADCVPVFLYDPRHEMIAVVHAGWRGAVAHIVQKTVRRMLELAVLGGTAGSQEIDAPELNDDLERRETLRAMKAAIGPSISPEAFEVGPEVAEQFVQAGFADAVRTRGYAKPHVDLWQVCVEDLLNEGIELENVDCTPLCTYGNVANLFSARQLGIRSGRVASCMMLK